MEREYIVCLKRGVDFDKFWDEMETNTIGHPTIPDRVVGIVDERVVSKRSCHYSLTDEEATLLRTDERVYCVMIPNDDIGLCAMQTGNFSKATGNDRVNWGLLRTIYNYNVYGENQNVAGNYTYCLDGTGVDIVISDTGIQADHPEWEDANGVSRLQQIDWFAESGVPGTMPVDHYTDINGHGTHVAAIAAGKRYGWAKNAHIYAINTISFNGQIPGVTTFDCILGWHNTKKLTGNTRPTILNLSWTTIALFNNMDAGENAHSYRGVPWTGTVPDESKGMIGGSGDGITFGSYNPSYDVAIQELIDAGVHVCKAAGNYFQKCDVPGGLDYDNYISRHGGFLYYYNRPSSPYDDEAMIVGATENLPHTGTGGEYEHKAQFSETGPAIDLYAPGDAIMSACSNSNIQGGFPYYWDGSYKSAVLMGTSMASPQVAGVGALLLQMEPTLTPSQLKNKILKACTDKLYSSGLDSDYTNHHSIQGGVPRILYMPFKDDAGLFCSGGISCNFGFDMI